MRGEKLKEINFSLTMQEKLSVNLPATPIVHLGKSSSSHGKKYLQSYTE